MKYEPGQSIRGMSDAELSVRLDSFYEEERRRRSPRDRAVIANVERLVATVFGFGDDEVDEARASVAAGLLDESERLKLSLPFAPSALPKTLEDAMGDVLELSAECAKAAARSDLPPASRSVLHLFRTALFDVARGEMLTPKEVAIFATLGRSNARFRGWAAFLGRCVELQTRSRR